ncbi:MAG TPA: hypothetical protein VGV87_15200 [Blastocatellia bacterium]|jgi:hypothetical protein|nr:hypothetical protein [Blastocatellia bacterium]
MLVGHFGVALVAKRVEPKLSLGTLMLAAMLADLLWGLFLVAGIEHVQFKPGRGAANYIADLDVAISHSLLMDVIWAALFAGAYFMKRHYAQGAYVVFVVVLSHWLLDVVSLAEPLAPGSSAHVGFGLWYSVPATVLVEGGFWLLAIILYVRATHPAKRAGIYAFWAVVVLLTLAWYNNITGPPPPGPVTAGISSLIFFSLVVAWAYWMNRLRPVEA